MIFEIAAGIVLAVLFLRYWRLLLWLILAAVVLWLVAVLVVLVWRNFGDLAMGLAILMAVLAGGGAVIRLFELAIPGITNGPSGQFAVYAALMVVISLFSAGTALLKADFQGAELMAGIAFTTTAGLLGLAAFWHRHRRPSAPPPTEDERPTDRIEPHF